MLSLLKNKGILMDHKFVNILVNKSCNFRDIFCLINILKLLLSSAFFNLPSQQFMILFVPLPLICLLIWLGLRP